jgi:hypothetical protein
MTQRMPVSLAALALCLMALTRSTDAQSAGRDPASRGIDLFVHASNYAAPGAILPVQVEAIGFPTVASFVPLGGATVEAAWNPEKMGASLAEAPPPVRATADAGGLAHLDVPVPEGEEGPLELLLGVRMGAHTRTRAVEVRRTRSSDVQIHVADPRVVPGSTIWAWVLVTSAATGAPIREAPVDLVLLEGGVARFETRLLTDIAGSVVARVPIPPTDEPLWSWILEARAFSGERASAARVTLLPREETPGTPELTASFLQPSVIAGDKADYVIRVRDASGQPVANQPIQTWIGPRGTQPPKDDKEWLRVSKRWATSEAGEVSGRVETPSTVVQGAGTSMQLVVRTNVEGHPLQKEASVAIGYGIASVELLPEAQSMVPGVLEHLLLRVHDGHHQPIAAPFLVEGDGLRTEVRTNTFGEAEVVWKAPPDLGAGRGVGPCAGGVAATVRVRPTADVPALAPRRDPFDLCVPVDREAGAFVRLDRTAARIGDRVHVEVSAPVPSGETNDKALERGPWSVIAQSNGGISSKAAWMEDGDRGADLELPRGEDGIWSISVASPAKKRPARVASAPLLVAPETLPKLSARVTGGRATPRGAVEIDATLTDERGQPLPGSIAALLVDGHGGGTTSGVEALDTRNHLCSAFEVERDRCEALVAGDPALDAVRRGDLGKRVQPPLMPLIDPGADVTEKLTRSFADVLLSLEGAVFQATASPDQLRDARRKVGSTWQFNPELMTLVTAAMKEPPQTPGGEALVLADLLAVDPQVTFDNVARRVTRLKLFGVLAAVRTFKHEHQLDQGEPALENPNALLRRLVREGGLTADALLDPWGGTIQFVRSQAPPLPFLSVIHGFELRAPGPDGTIGDGDDVRDPFARVLQSGTPYAQAVEEDRIVDAKFDMEVGDATVAEWQSLFNELTGTRVGEAFGAGGLGTSGVGEGGGGRGDGIGLGRFGGLGGRASFGVDRGVAFFAPPARTGGDGHLHLHVPLGDLETTWRLALVALADRGAPATTVIDIPVSLQLSARIDAGARWIEGDEVGVSITVRNRTKHPLTAMVTAAAGGVAEIAEKVAGKNEGPRAFVRPIQVPAEGAAVTHVRVRATRPGEAHLDVRVQAAGLADDTVVHSWQVAPSGDLADFSGATWVDKEAELERTPPPPSFRILGAPRLVLERGFDLALSAALESLDPDSLATPGAMADAIEVAGRVRRWAIARGGERDPLAERAGELAKRATGKLAVYAGLNATASHFSVARALTWAPADVAGRLGEAAECPGDAGTLAERLLALEAEPPPVGGSTKTCWDAFVADEVDEVTRLGDATELALAVLALAEHPHRALVAATLSDRLRERVSLEPSGAISLAPTLAGRRSARAIVFSSLLRSIRLGKGGTAGADKLAAWVLVQRDTRGGYGSSEATRSVVRALLAEGLAANGSSRVTVEMDGTKRELDLAPSAHLVLPLESETTRLRLRVAGQGVIARFEQPVLRLWSHPPDEGLSGLHLEAIWPAEPRAGGTGILRLLVRHSPARSTTADLRVPLPPGVSLAEPLRDVRQVQGVLTVRRVLDATELPTAVEIPLRFGLAGRVTTPEAVARVAFDESPRAFAPARPLTIWP